MLANQLGTAMGRPGVRTVAIRDQILAALRVEWPLPISTRRVCELLGASRYDETGHRIYPQLCALDRMGIVERIRREPDCRDVFWRFLGDPTDDELNAAVDTTRQAELVVRESETTDIQNGGDDEERVQAMAADRCTCQKEIDRLLLENEKLRQTVSTLLSTNNLMNEAVGIWTMPAIPNN